MWKKKSTMINNILEIKQASLLYLSVFIAIWVWIVFLPDDDGNDQGFNTLIIISERRTEKRFWRYW